MLYGTLIKAYSGHYYVQTGGKVTSCSLRGRFKKERFSLHVGDEVGYEAAGQDKGVIEEILPRRSLLKRPCVANIDQVVVTFAAANPDINPLLVDRFLGLVELSGLDAILCVNKMDLADTAEIEPILAEYQAIGYPVITVSARLGLGTQELHKSLTGRITVFTGPSGVGKSTILNTVEPGLSLTTGEVSEKIGRGRHTTRYAELMPLSGGGFVVDTPGFSLTEFEDLTENDIGLCFREIRSLAPHCRFSSCLHDKEPQCAVKQAVTDGLISRRRYDAYLGQLAEARENKKGY